LSALGAPTGREFNTMLRLMVVDIFVSSFEVNGDAARGACIRKKSKCLFD
jgi:hypothetical protein